ncbi:hypothetical protein GMOD_00006540 [Pyrenophora seminiperda CCB06]|uniref:Uncharacterized protein n=1 Tax=Pyrenophora seminiperda CCB06 TaxID=1302712 RepID=A0A3M7MA79_9PLEO|nr:hypothetical protein GMOD_00006540 [Pyrenophora seminiperda CCB06]
MALSPQYPPNYRMEAPSNSIYTRPSPNPYPYDNPTAPSYSSYEDISPPSSPEPDREYSTSSNSPQRFRSMRDVSPMDEHRKQLESEARAGSSHIPVLRRAPSVLRNGESAGPKQKFWDVKLAPNSKVKWDEYSGEPNMAGKAASVDPGSYAKGAPTTQPMGYQVSVTTGAAENRNASLGARVGRFGSKRTPPPPVEPFARATGRSEIAPPLKYQPASKPIVSPPAHDRDNSNARAAAVDFASKLGDTLPVTGETRQYGQQQAHNQPIKPIVPLKVGRNSPSRSGLSSPTSPTHQGLGISALAYSNPVIETNTAPQDQSLHPAFRTATPPYNNYTATATTAASRLRDQEDEVPESRFSWTTHNSGQTYQQSPFQHTQHSPPPSPPEPLQQPPPPQRKTPSPPSSSTTTPTTATAPAPAAPHSSILSRRRPIPQSNILPPTPPKPTMSPHPLTSYTNTNTGTSKALPQPPTHLSCHDHIQLLEAQQDDLRIRRNNVYRLLRDLNNAAPPNPLLTDFKKQRVADARKKAFEEELQQIRQEEHDVGLKLHRAWKKREREDGGGGGVRCG